MPPWLGIGWRGLEEKKRSARKVLINFIYRDDLVLVLSRLGRGLKLTYHMGNLIGSSKISPPIGRDLSSRVSLHW